MGVNVPLNRLFCVPLLGRGGGVAVGGFRVESCFSAALCDRCCAPQVLRVSAADRVS